MNLMSTKTLFMSILVAGVCFFGGSKEQSRRQLLASKMVFSEAPKKERSLASKTIKEFSQLYLKVRKNNIKRFNGAWEVVKSQEYFEGTLIKTTAPKAQVNVELVEDEDGWATVKISNQNINQFYTIYNMSEANDYMELYRFISDEVTEYIVLKPGRSNVVTTASTFNNQIQRDATDSFDGVDTLAENADDILTLDLKEAYDPTQKKVIKDDLSGAAEVLIRQNKNRLSEVVIYSLGATISGNDIEAANLTQSDRNTSDFSYEGGGEVGMVRVSSIGNGEINVYFTSGPYKQYTLIFSKPLSEEQLREKEETAYERDLAEADRESSASNEAPVNEEEQEELIEDQEEAVKERIEAGNKVDQEVINDIGLFLEDTKWVEDKLRKGEELTAEEKIIMEERAEAIMELSGVRF